MKAFQIKGSSGGVWNNEEPVAQKVPVRAFQCWAGDLQTRSLWLDAVLQQQLPPPAPHAANMLACQEAFCPGRRVRVCERRFQLSAQRDAALQLSGDRCGGIWVSGSPL